MMTSVAVRVWAAEPAGVCSAEWNALMDGMARPRPFDTPAWHAAWWRHLGGADQRIDLTLRDAGTLVAVLPLMRRGEMLTLAGDPQVCDIAALPVAADHDRTALAELLEGARSLVWQQLHLWGIPDGSSVVDTVERWAGTHGYAVSSAVEAVCPRVPLPESWDAYLAQLAKKDRHELKRKLRRFTEAGAVAHQVARTPADVARGMDTFLHLHRISRQDKAAFMTVPMEAFFREMTVRLAAEGRVRLHHFTVDMTPVAALLTFVSGDELLLYNSGYDPVYASVSVGVVSKALALQSAISEGLRVFDFLRGSEAYKYDLGAVDLPVRQLWVTRNDRD